MRLTYAVSALVTSVLLVLSSFVGLGTRNHGSEDLVLPMPEQTMDSHIMDSPQQTFVQSQAATIKASSSAAKTYNMAAEDPSAPDIEHEVIPNSCYCNKIVIWIFVWMMLCECMALNPMNVGSTCLPMRPLLRLPRRKTCCSIP